MSYTIPAELLDGDLLEGRKPTGDVEIDKDHWFGKSVIDAFLYSNGKNGTNDNYDLVNGANFNHEGLALDGTDDYQDLGGDDKWLSDEISFYAKFTTNKGSAGQCILLGNSRDGSSVTANRALEINATNEIYLVMGQTNNAWAITPKRTINPIGGDYECVGRMSTNGLDLYVSVDGGSWEGVRSVGVATPNFDYSKTQRLGSSSHYGNYFGGTIHDCILSTDISDGAIELLKSKARYQFLKPVSPPLRILTSTLSQNHNITPQALTHGVALDASALSSAANINPAELLHGVFIDASALVQSNAINPAALDQSAALDASALTQGNNLTPAQIDHASTLDASTLTQLSQITPQGITAGQTLESSSLLVAGVIAVSDLDQAQTVSASALTQAHQMAVSNVLQSVALDSAQLTQHHQITGLNLNHAQSLSVSSLATFNGVTPQNITHASELDAVIITQHYVLTPQAIAQGVILDATLIDNGLAPDIVKIIGQEVTIVRTLSATQNINQIITSTGRLS